MRSPFARVAVAATAFLACSLIVTAGPSSAAPGRPAVVPSAHDVVVAPVDGSSTLTVYPAYSDSVKRYGVIPDSATNGNVTVTATDATGTILVDGKPATSGQPVELDGLKPGDEISVIFDDGGTPSAQSWIYLPTGFPHLDVTTDDTAHQQPGYWFMGLQSFTSGTTYDAVVDHNAVPVYTNTTDAGQDFKAYPGTDGVPAYYTVASQSGGDSPVTGTAYRILELDRSFHVVRTIYSPDQLTSPPPAQPLLLDFHDSVVKPDGSALLMGESSHTDSSSKTWMDAVIEVVSPDHQVLFRWDSKDHTDPSDSYVAPSTPLGYDYAHINSLQWLDDGDIVASFRNLGTVMRIATSGHDGFQPGDVEWELGGKHSTFTFPHDTDPNSPGDPLGGNCAQHNAKMVDDTHIQVFDNGSQLQTSGPIAAQTANMCPDPTAADPNTTRTARPQTRVTTYALDTSANTATLTHDYEVAGRYAPFAGNWDDETGGNMTIGWSQAVQADGSLPPLATEVTPSGTEVWSVSSPPASGSPGTPLWFSYRVFKFDAPDAQSPVVTWNQDSLQGAVLHEGDTAPTVSYSCTDAGGSNLQSCTGSVAQGGSVPMTPGTHTVSVTGRDGAGNTTTTSATYEVLAAYQPDATIAHGSGAAVGANVVGGAGKQTIGASLPRRTATTFFLRLRNAGTQADAFTVSGPAGTPRFAVHYFAGTIDVTRQVTSGRYHIPSLASGASSRLRMVVRNLSAVPGTHHVLRVTTTSTHNARRYDVVGADVLTRR